MKTLQLPSGQTVAALGQGTWNIGEDPAARQAEVHALQLGIDLGMTLIDTAEMYGEGGAEEVVGAAIAGRREQVFLVSKVYPHNASVAGVQAACERSLRRLKVEQIDLYLLHWRGSVPLKDTLEGFQRLREQGKIGAFGVSNFDLDDMQEAYKLPGGREIAVNQVLFNLKKRGIEFDLLPWCRQHKLPVMAYSPLESAGPERLQLLATPALLAVAQRHGASSAQIALAWVLRHPGVTAIPKAVAPQHVRENRAALDIVLSEEDLLELDRAFAPPTRKIALAMR
jgi:diketogulonate reductase-like aldo/keto reductase